MTTARDIIYRALEDVGVIGVGQTPLAEDMNFGLLRLNAMIGQFNRRRWLIPHLRNISCITNGSGVYSVGIGGDFNCPRPDRLEDGNFFRQSIGGSLSNGGSDFNEDFNDDFGHGDVPQNQNLVDYPLTLLESKEDWNRIALKYMPSWPSFAYYDPANVMLPPVNNPNGPPNPCGFLHINPVPAPDQFEIFICVKDVLTTLENLSTVLATPPEYEEAFEYNLALRFFAKYQLPASPEVAGLARASLATIRSANNQIQMLSLPSALNGRGRRYNVYSDRSN